MTNVSGTAQKLARRGFLFQAAVTALEKEGWTVERIPGSGKGSLRRISKGTTQKTVTIRTSQDTWIAFPRTEDDKGWATLGEADYVVASTVDNWERPRYAHVHLIGGDEMRARFDSAYAARKAAKHALPVGRGIWVSLYDEESQYPVNRVGAGAGNSNPPIAKVPLKGAELGLPVRAEQQTPDLRQPAPPVANGVGISIQEAKRLLAMSFGVNESDIKITVCG
jgi:hypothetical protein